MKQVIIEVPDKWEDDPCLLCPARDAGKCNMTINTCPLSKAKEAVEHKIPGVRYYTDDGVPLKLWSTEDK